MNENSSRLLAGLLVALATIVAATVAAYISRGRLEVEAIVTLKGDQAPNSSIEPPAYRTPMPTTTPGPAAVPAPEVVKEDGVQDDGLQSGGVVSASNAPSPIHAVQSYWAAVDAESYHTAWAMLSSSFQSRNHYGDYVDYVRARRSMQVCSVRAEYLKLREERAGTAAVECALIFHAGRSCRRSIERFVFYLVSQGERSWYIDRVEHQ